MTSPTGATLAGAEPDPDAIAAVVRGVNGVVDLSGGAIGEVATYLPGRRVTGVQVGEDSIEVHVVAEYGLSVLDVADQVRTAVRGLEPQRIVNVAIDDVRLPGEDSAEPDEQDAPSQQASPPPAGPLSYP
jgi:uncharacterized alkaline shock family protein YloU